MARLNGVDPRNPTLSSGAVRVVGGQFIETDSNGVLGTWNLDFIVPAYAVIVDVIVSNEVNFGATAATLVVGDYEVDSSDGSIGDALDADGFLTGVTVISGGNCAAGESIHFAQLEDAVDGAYLGLSDNPNNNGITHTADRYIRASLTTATAVGTQAGKVFVYVVYAVPELDVPTFTAA